MRAQVTAALGDLAGTSHAVAASIALARRLRRPEAEATAERTMGELLLETGDVEAAKAAAARAVSLSSLFDSPSERRSLLTLLRALHPRVANE